jgi:hypothetical protein
MSTRVIRYNMAVIINLFQSSAAPDDPVTIFGAESPQNFLTLN